MLMATAAAQSQPRHHRRGVGRRRRRRQGLLADTGDEADVGALCDDDSGSVVTVLTMNQPVSEPVHDKLQEHQQNQRRLRQPMLRTLHDKADAAAAAAATAVEATAAAATPKHQLANGHGQHKDGSDSSSRDDSDDDSTGSDGNEDGSGGDGREAGINGRGSHAISERSNDEDASEDECGEEDDDADCTSSDDEDVRAAVRGAVSDSPAVRSSTSKAASSVLWGVFDPARGTFQPYAPVPSAAGGSADSDRDQYVFGSSINDLHDVLPIGDPLAATAPLLFNTDSPRSAVLVPGSDNGQVAEKPQEQHLQQQGMPMRWLVTAVLSLLAVVSVMALALGGLPVAIQLDTPANVLVDDTSIAFDVSFSISNANQIGYRLERYTVTSLVSARNHDDTGDYELGSFVDDSHPWSLVPRTERTQHLELKYEYAALPDWKAIQALVMSGQFTLKLRMCATYQPQQYLPGWHRVAVAAAARDGGDAEVHVAHEIDIGHIDIGRIAVTTAP